jgi:type II secretory pathway pseudopilin PulG
MLVLSLILIVVTISIPRLGLFVDFSLSHEIEHLEVIYHYLQQRAIAGNKTHVLTFDLKGNRYTASAGNLKLVDRVMEKGVKFGFLPNSYGPPATPTNLLSKPINLDVPLNLGSLVENLNVKFLSNGKITAGTIYFIDRHNKRMGALTCSLSHVSYIRRYRYDGFKWSVF